MVSRLFLNDSIDFPLLSLFILFFFFSGQAIKTKALNCQRFIFVY